MINKLKILYVFLTIIITFVCGLYMFLYRVNNPLMTETQLMLYTLRKFWWLIIMVLVMIGLKFK